MSIIPTDNEEGRAVLIPDSISYNPPHEYNNHYTSFASIITPDCVKKKLIENVYTITNVQSKSSAWNIFVIVCDNGVCCMQIM